MAAVCAYYASLGLATSLEQQKRDEELAESMTNVILGTFPEVKASKAPQLIHAIYRFLQENSDE